MTQASDSTLTITRKGTARDAIALLKADHERVKALLTQLSESTERALKKRTELLAKLEAEISLHTKLEEEILYPAFRKAGGKEQDIMYHEAKEEHRTVDSLVLPDTPVEGARQVIEDLISTGKSSLEVVEVLRKAGVEVIGMVSIFTYGFDVAAEAFQKAGVEYRSLTNYPTLINLAIDKQIVEASEQEVLLKWSKDPAHWLVN